MASPVDLLRDPEFLSLPPQEQAGLRQEALGTVIVDPDFQALQEADFPEAMALLAEINQQQAPPPREFHPSQIVGEVGSAVGEVVGDVLKTDTEAAQKIWGYTPEQMGQDVLEKTQPYLGETGGALAATGMHTARELLTPLNVALVGIPSAVKKGVEGVKAGMKVAEEVAPVAAKEAEAVAPAVRSVVEQPPVQKQPDLFEQRVSIEQTKNIKAAVIQDVEKLAQTQAGQEGQRVSRQVVQAVEQGLIDVAELPPLLQKTGLTMEQFAKELLDTYSTAGKQLNTLSQIKRQMLALAEKNPEMKEAIDAFAKEVPDTFWERFKYAYTKVDNVRRGLLVSQVATTMRNIMSQTGRYGVEMLDAAIESKLGGSTGGKAEELAMSFFRNMKPSEAKKVNAILDQFPVEEAKLFNSPVGELHLGTKITRMVNVLNMTQEKFFRRALFDATLRTDLKAAGRNVEEALANPKSIPYEMIENATMKALEGTFAAPAKPGTFGKAITDVYQKFPMLTTINPFPRFWANSIDFLTSHNPAGFVKLIGETDPKKRAEIMSKAITGTAMFAAALAVKEGGLSGPKWYQIKAGEEGGKDRYIDTRSYAPFSTFLFMADVADTMATIGTDMISNGESLKQALIENKKYTTNDLLQGIVSINRIAGTGLVAVDLAREGTMDRKMDLLRDFMAQYLGGFTVPFRTIKDVVSAVDPEEAKLRDLRENFWGPAQQNIPYLSQKLPETKSPTQTETPRSEHPLLRQLTGLSVKTENIVQKEIDTLGIEFAKIAAKTGLPEVDREIYAKMGPIVELQLGRLIQSPAYQQIKNPEMKRFVLTAAISYMRSQATQMLKEERPDLEQKMKLEQVPKGVKDLMISLGLPDLDKIGR